MKFRTAYKPDSKDYGYPKHHRLIAASLPTLPTPNLYPFRKGEIWQGPYGMCTGESTERCAQLWFSANGYGDEVMLSGAWNYLMGMLAAYDGQDPESVPKKFPDDGAEPGLEFRGLRNLGFLLEEDFPSPQTLRFDALRMFTPPVSSDLVKAYDARELQWHAVPFTTMATLRASMRSLMVRRTPVKVAMFVDTGVMRNQGEIVTSILRDDPDGGGHDVTVLDASHDEFVQLDNWWCVSPELAARIGVLEQPWGALDGTWRITWECLAEHCMQALAFTAGPLNRLHARKDA